MPRNELVSPYEDPDRLQESMRGWKPEAVLQWAWESLGSNLVMRADFGLIDLPVLFMVAQICPELPIFFVDAGSHPRKHLVFRDRLAREWRLNLEICKKEPKILAHAALLQSDLAGSRTIENQGRLRIRPLALWSLADLHSYLQHHSLPRPPCFASLPSVEAMADWLSLPPDKIQPARPPADLPPMQNVQIFRALPRNSGPKIPVLGLGYYDGQKVAALDSLQALGQLLRLEGKPVEAYPDEELAQLVNLLSNQRTLTTPAALKKMGRLDEGEFARVSQSFVPLHRIGPGQLRWTTVPDDLDPHPQVAVQTLTWNDFTLSQEAPLVLSSQLFRSRPTLIV